MNRYETATERRIGRTGAGGWLGSAGILAISIGIAMGVVWSGSDFLTQFGNAQTSDGIPLAAEPGAQTIAPSPAISPGDLPPPRVSAKPATNQTAAKLGANGPIGPIAGSGLKPTAIPPGSSTPLPSGLPGGSPGPTMPPAALPNSGQSGAGSPGNASLPPAGLSPAQPTLPDLPWASSNQPPSAPAGPSVTPPGMDLGGQPLPGVPLPPIILPGNGGSGGDFAETESAPSDAPASPVEDAPTVMEPDSSTAPIGPMMTPVSAPLIDPISQIAADACCGEIDSTAKDAPTPATDDFIPDFDFSGPYVIQLASLENHDAACAVWDTLRANYPGLFAGAETMVLPANLADGRTVYRLRAGAFANRDAANAFCEAYIRKGGACFVTRR